MRCMVMVPMHPSQCHAITMCASTFVYYTDKSMFYVCVSAVGGWCVYRANINHFHLGGVIPPDVGHSAWPQGCSSVTIGE